MVTDNNADYLVDLFPASAPLHLFVDEFRSVENNPFPEKGYRLYLEFHMDNPAGLGVHPDIHDAQLVLFEQAFKEGVDNGQMIELILGQVKDKFEESVQDGDIAHIAEEEFECVIVQRGDKRFVLCHIKNLRSLYMGLAYVAL
jgi:uncharacterized protein YheU (UPF0270 family)